MFCFFILKYEKMYHFENSFQKSILSMEFSCFLIFQNRQQFWRIGNKKQVTCIWEEKKHW